VPQVRARSLGANLGDTNPKNDDNGNSKTNPGPRTRAPEQGLQRRICAVAAPCPEAGGLVP